MCYYQFRHLHEVLIHLFISVSISKSNLCLYVDVYIIYICLFSCPLTLFLQISYIIKNPLFLFLIMCMCAGLCMLSIHALVGHRRPLDPLELKVQVVVYCLIWVQGIELGSCIKVVCTLNH